MMDWTKYTIQNIRAVDMCAATIAAHRANQMPIKAIHLIPEYYKEFESWTQKNLNRDLLRDEKMQFDDVYIERGDKRQKSALLIELWVSKEELDKFMKEKFSTTKMGIA